MEALHEICPVVLEKIFENGGRTDDGACLYYKLTNEPKGSGELKMLIFTQYKNWIKISF